ncbi:TRAP-type C4-dicarboxylate transport system substrate-binding protein [Devosia subaequoris]|uniref:TRAP-type C4-dicarboxylate transport system substrate-binding protein n=1 Tax=Devosia subaequoris TaxID=395930 RepID=A0A7W6IM45_9HYPH|nr:TRAP transporter substrate-binding protein DctP [Devosia subaequoris]MBB4052115.1 TRAP-type C4-dicarboxylate transport system substrate-binding protein [Devosia subaequoris]MCP1210277.1 TRAP transporter substrate-binding protein DctP [Devosia subaequoris]
MNISLSRRALMVGGLVLAAAFPALAQDNPTLRFSAVFSEQDIRAEMINLLSSQVADFATVEPYYGATLFAQGTELVALQRGNLELGNIAPQDISNQIPAWSLLTSAYLFRDAAHLRAFFDSEVGAEFKQMASDQLGIKILGPTYFGARQVGLRGDKKIATPADMAGIKLRMPGGDAWQFLGTSLGANPTPMAYAEVYTGLQTGAIDGQDNPLPNVENMKFYEVMDQIVLTSHLVGFDLLVISNSAWDAMNPEQQEAFQAAAKVAIDFSQEEHLKREAELVDRFKSVGLDIYEPDQDAFRTYAQQKYLESDLANDWPGGALDAINAL